LRDKRVFIAVGRNYGKEKITTFRLKKVKNLDGWKGEGEARGGSY